MTNSEFSNEFDVLYQNITSNQAPGLDEYEKSVFLSKAQDEIVKSYFDPKTNKPQEGFDGSEKRQIDFSMLIVTEAVHEATVSPTPLFPLQHTKLFSIPDRILMFINESLAVERDGVLTYLTVVPLDYKEYNRLMSKPYKRPLKWQAWRLLTNYGTTKKAEIIVGPNDTLTAYYIRYIKRPQAIILSDLEGVTLDNKTTAQECELDPILHQEILQRAVELAKAAYIGDLNSNVELGKRSE